jgi:cytochrome b561
MIAHIIFGGMAGILTLALALPILYMNSIVKFDTHNHMGRHLVIGIAILLLVSLQLSLGITNILMKRYKKNSPWGILSLKTCHKLLGYGLLLLCKIQVYLQISANRN